MAAGSGAARALTARVAGVRRDDTTENEKHFSWTYLEPGMTIVVDDNREVWGSSPNVIHIYAYKFWK